MRDLWASPEGPANAAEGAWLATLAAAAIGATLDAPLPPAAAAVRAAALAGSPVAPATAETYGAALAAAARVMMARPRYCELLLPALLLLARSSPARLSVFQVRHTRRCTQNLIL